MKPVPFAYHRPATVAEAVELLATLDEPKVLAGGQSLVPLMNFRMAAPANLVDVSRLDELAGIDVDDRAVTVGAAVTHTELLEHTRAVAAVPLLGQAERLVAHEVIRNRGTVCGSLAHADPAGELTAVLALLGGSVEALSVRGPRTIPAADLFVGPLMSSVADDELVTAARFPRPSATTSTAIREVARRHGDYAVCGALVAVDRPTPTGPIASARAAFLSVGPTPVVIDLDPVVAGRSPSDIDRGQLYDHVIDRVDPSEDIHATADYRRHLAGVLAGQAVGDALVDPPREVARV
ncbi:MAG: FAD binding domain-containing protein [Actinomycetota bacterium]